MTVTSACSGELLDLFGQRPRRGGVTLAHVGGQDQDTAGPGTRCESGFAVATSHIEKPRPTTGGRCPARMRAHGRKAPRDATAVTGYRACQTLAWSARRNNEAHAGHDPPYPAFGSPGGPPSGVERRAARGSERALRALGALGLIGVLTTVFLLTAGAASRPSQYVPARSGGWPDWLAGPLRGLGVGITPNRFQTLTLIMCASYLAVLLAARTLSVRALAVTIIAAHLVLLLGPPLISQDVFGYLDFARLGALHGLDPYTHVAAQAPTDAVYPFIGWPFQHSPYGPLFTLASYATAPLGLAGGLWALKALAVASSLGAVALAKLQNSRAPRAARGRVRRRFAAAFVGLNPVLLELAVGGAHNDMLMLLALAAALALTAGRQLAFSRRRGGAGRGGRDQGHRGAGAAVPRARGGPDVASVRAVALAAGLSLALLAAVGLIGFGSHALGFLSAVGEQQQLVATHSIPAETARLVGLHGTPSWWRHCFIAAFVVVLAFALWRIARGADWRVAAGWTMLALLLSTAWLLPWYAIWPLPLAAVSGDRRLRAATLIFCAYAVLIHLPLASPLLSPESAARRPRRSDVSRPHRRARRHRDSTRRSRRSRSPAPRRARSPPARPPGRSRRRRIASRRRNLRISSTYTR